MIPKQKISWLVLAIVLLAGISYFAYSAIIAGGDTTEHSNVLGARSAKLDQKLRDKVPGGADKLPEKEREPLSPSEKERQTCVQRAEQVFSNVQEPANEQFDVATKEQSALRIGKKKQADEALEIALTEAGDKSLEREAAYNAHKEAIVAADAEFDATTIEEQHARDALINPAREKRAKALEECNS